MLLRVARDRARFLVRVTKVGLDLNPQLESHCGSLRISRARDANQAAFQGSIGHAASRQRRICQRCYRPLPHVRACGSVAQPVAQSGSEEIEATVLPPPEKRAATRRTRDSEELAGRLFVKLGEGSDVQ